ncbi:GNAT family N-acetyltransferase [Shewanella marina]|uniref:GNAT family N-acetyltransferase n=1 Tax=Shewanella marina TaxID=487319 RepID=UPI000AD1C26B|nr:GNAT family N-acetyltransferase [Shewanella marina]
MIYTSATTAAALVGKALLNQAKQHALNTKAMGISLQTSSDNLQAQSLYESLGYQQKHDFYHYFLNLIDS